MRQVLVDGIEDGLPVIGTQVQQVSFNALGILDFAHPDSRSTSGDGRESRFGSRLADSPTARPIGPPTYQSLAKSFTKMVRKGGLEPEKEAEMIDEFHLKCVAMWH